VYLHVRDLETNLPAIVSDILHVVGKELRGAVVYDRTAEQSAEEVQEEVRQPATKGEDTSEKREKKKQ